MRAGLSLACLTLSLSYAAFWVRSRYYDQELHFGTGPDRRAYICSTYDGLRFESRPTFQPAAFRWESDPRGQTFRGPRFPWEHDKLVLGFAYAHGRRGWGLATPHWFPVLAFALAAIAIAPPPRWRVSLRRLLAIMTVATLVFGALASSM